MEHSTGNPQEQAVRALSQAVSQNVEKFRGVMDRQELNIDKIEAMWSELRAQTDRVINEL